MSRRDQGRGPPYLRLYSSVIPIRKFVDGDELPQENGRLTVRDCVRPHATASLKDIFKGPTRGDRGMSRPCRGRGRGPVPGMRSRKLLGIALAASALYAGVLVASASAELHRVQVTLVTGQVLTVTVDVPAGTPVTQVQIPGLPAAVQNVVDLGPVATPTVPKVSVPEVKRSEEH